ncbi:MAG: bifunctional glutamate N-acetyltransferase/amino-acid acetyltransferase ArgJ, partial [Myxococcales bacterium]|nr:bifunctional glutamate N-acetyltransferase/amino-acid acetyltransferase ArgJ [Myxococcales bacterium]
AGMFTTSATAAAPVHLCRRVLARHETVRSIVVNSGNANALTGSHGEDAAAAMAVATERVCGGPALVLSTGVIGVPLPVDRVVDGIAATAAELSREASVGVARAILTTDTCTKTHALEGRHQGRTFTVGGIAKGSGMIHPNMATMLAVMATDMPVPAPELRALLERVVDRSFHEISVDGDTSTNDAVVLLAPPARDCTRAALETLEEAVTEVARRLAGLIIEDGEGATRVLDLQVIGAAREPDARAVAKAVARSSLVKTALAGGDPNWGRILAAAGTAGVALDPRSLSLDIGPHRVFHRGQPTFADGDLLARVFEQDRVTVTLDLGTGAAISRVLTTDLTHRYVEINSEYTT